MSTYNSPSVDSMLRKLGAERTPEHTVGQGDAPIKQVLQLLKQNKYAIPADIEYEYRGEGPVAEVRKCFQYIKNALA